MKTRVYLWKCQGCGATHGTRKKGTPGACPACGDNKGMAFVEERKLLDVKKRRSCDGIEKQPRGV